MKSFLLVLCVALSVVGCNSSKNMAKLSGVKWVLQTLNDKELSLTDPNSEIFIQFNEAEHRVNGRGGCNRFFGNYEMESSRLKFSPMGATRMALSRPTDRNGIFPNAGWCRRLFDQRQQTFFPV